MQIFGEFHFRRGNSAKTLGQEHTQQVLRTTCEPMWTEQGEECKREYSVFCVVCLCQYNIMLGLVQPDKELGFHSK